MMAADKTQNRSNNIEHIAKGIDEVFIKLVWLSPIALIILLLSDQARDWGYVMILAGILAALVWARID